MIVPMNRKSVVAILLVAAVPVCAQAQKPSAAKVTKADAQKVVKIISGDKAKTQTYCDMAWSPLMIFTTLCASFLLTLGTL
jgi:hypothetical protein